MTQTLTCKLDLIKNNAVATPNKQSEINKVTKDILQLIHNLVINDIERSSDRTTASNFLATSDNNLSITRPPNRNSTNKKDYSRLEVWKLGMSKLGFCL